MAQTYIYGYQLELENPRNGSIPSVKYTKRVIPVVDRPKTYKTVTPTTFFEHKTTLNKQDLGEVIGGYIHVGLTSQNLILYLTTESDAEALVRLKARMIVFLNQKRENLLKSLNSVDSYLAQLHQ